MSQRVHQNIQEYCGRRLAKQYDNAGTAAGTAKAIGLNAPTTRSQAMGTSGKQGIVSFVCQDGGTQAYTLYEWHEGMAQLNTGNGWMKNGGAAAEYTKTCDAKAIISFTITESVDFFIQAGTTPVTDAFVSGTESAHNKNTDLSQGRSR